MPTLGEFVLYAKRRFNFDRRAIRLEGPEGTEELPYLWRNDRVFAELPSRLRDSDRLTKNQVEGLCARLDIPKEDFGL